MKVPFRALILCLLFFSIAAACRSLKAIDEPPGNSEPFKIVFVGDILLDDSAQTYLDQNGYDWPFEYLRDNITGDFLIGNAEGPITSRETPLDPNQVWSYNADPPAAQALAGFGFDALGLSNNHVLDRGPQGLADTLANLDANGINSFGAGMDQTQASAPLLIETPLGSVAVIALSEDWGADRTAGVDQAGTIPLSRSNIRRGYDLALAGGAKWVVAYVHWGANYAPVSPAQRRWAQEFTAAGYDLVIGHGAHSLQPIELINGIPVLYSLGNFVFTTPGRFTPEFPGLGLVFSVDLGPQGFYHADLICIQTDNQSITFQPRICTPEQKVDFSSILKLEDFNFDPDDGVDW